MVEWVSYGKNYKRANKKNIMDLTMLIVNRQTIHFGGTTPVNGIILWLLQTESINSF